MDCDHDHVHWTLSRAPAIIALNAGPAWQGHPCPGCPWPGASFRHVRGAVPRPPSSMAFVYTPEAQKMRRPPALSRLTKEHRNSWGHFSLKMNPDFSASDWLRNFRLKHPTQLYGRFSGFRLKCFSLKPRPNLVSSASGREGGGGAAEGREEEPSASSTPDPSPGPPSAFRPRTPRHYFA